MPPCCLALHNLTCCVSAAEDVIARLIPPRLAACAQSADHLADQASGPAHPALWAPLAQQPPSCLTPSPSPPALSAATDQDCFVEDPSLSFCPISSGLGDMGQLQAEALSNCPSLPSTFNGINDDMWQLGQHSNLSAATNAHVPSTIPAVGSYRRRMPMMHSNIVPLQSLVWRSKGSKRMYNSFFDSSRRAAPLRRAASSTCNHRDQQELATGSGSGDIDSNIQQQQQQQDGPNVPGTRLWTRTARLARMVSFPVRVTRAYYSYVPLGQQLYLNPQSVTTSMQSPHQAMGVHVGSNGTTSSAVASAAEGASAPAVPGATMHADSRVAQQQQPTAASVSDAVTDMLDSIVLQRREQLGRLWMHRMPTYRARFQQIFFSALGQALPLPLPSLHSPDEGQEASHCSSSQHKPIAPEIHVRRAEACAGSLLASHHLKDMLKVCSLL